MYKIIITSAVVVISIILIYAATKPDTFRVQRSIIINATPQKIFTLLSDFHRWNEWSPYEKKDPSMRRNFSASSSGIGAIYEWDGNNEVGKGRMEIIDIDPPNKIIIKLDFIKPFDAHNQAEFTLEASSSNSTTITWLMHGPSPYISKLISIFMDFDNMIGKDFETGLVDLKTLVEK